MWHLISVFLYSGPWVSWKPFVYVFVSLDFEKKNIARKGCRLSFWYFTIKLLLFAGHGDIKRKHFFGDLCSCWRAEVIDSALGFSCFFFFSKKDKFSSDILCWSLCLLDVIRRFFACLEFIKCHSWCFALLFCYQKQWSDHNLSCVYTAIVVTPLRIRKIVREGIE